jgi:hypothetical protein
MHANDDALLIPRTLRTVAAMLAACVLFLGALSTVAAVALSQKPGAGLGDRAGESSAEPPNTTKGAKQPAKLPKGDAHPDQSRTGTSI